MIDFFFGFLTGTAMSALVITGIIQNKKKRMKDEK